MPRNGTEAALSSAATELLKRRAESLAQEAVDEESTDQVGILLFRLGDEWYSIEVSEVREIYQEYAITPIPCVPSFILGVVNIRGEIISVTDLARLMNMGSLTTELGIAPAIVIQNDDCTTAIVVDEIGDISDVSRDDIEPPLSVMDKAAAEFVAGSIHLDDRMIGLLSIDRILEPIGVST